MQIIKSNFVITSWFEEMANHANYSIAIKDVNHQYIFVNRAHTDYASLAGNISTAEIIVDDEAALTDRKSLNSTATRVTNHSQHWQRDKDAMTSGVPTFHLEKFKDKCNVSNGKTYTARYPLLQNNGNTTHLLIITMTDDFENDVARQNESNKCILNVVLDLNPDLHIAKTSPKCHGIKGITNTPQYEFVNSSDISFHYCDTALFANQSRLHNGNIFATGSTLNTFYDTHVSFNDGPERIYPHSDITTAPHIYTTNNTVNEYLTLEQQKNTLQLLEREREQIARRLEIQSSLSALVKEMEYIKEYIPLLQRIAEVIIKLLGADTTYLTIVDESNEFMEVVAVAGSNLSRIGFKLRYGEGIGGVAWQKGEIQAISDYPKYMNKINGFDDFKQVCVIPIKVHGHVLGVIGVVYETYSDMFMERVIEFEEFSQQITIIVENAKLIESVRIELARNQVLYKLSNTLYLFKDIQTVLEYACDIVIEHCDTKIMQIFQTDDDGTIYLSAMAGVCEKEHTEGTVTQHTSTLNTIDDILNPDLVQKCLETKKPILISRLSVTTDKQDSVFLARQQHGIGSSVCIPLVHDEIVWGAFVAHRDISKSDYSAEDINLFGAIANQASLALNRQKLQSEIEFQAYHDTLTGLCNRLQFEEKLNDTVENGKKDDFRVAVLFIDLDGFKNVNDNYGHSAGDALLRDLSKRLLQIFHSDNVVARMGGDEFAVILSHIDTLSEIVTISEHAIQVLSEEYSIEGVVVKIGASIGISIFPDDSDSAGTLLKNADFAMYQSKSKGKGCAQYYDNAMARRFQRRIDNESDLANAIDKNELKLYFQPKVSVSSQRVLGVEALLRWKSQTRGYISPEEFIPIAEESGLIIPIGDWVLKQACRQLATWHQMGFDDLAISVNVSAPQFSTGNYVHTVENVLKSVKLDARFLDIEVTESVMMVDVEQSVKKLLELKALGISVSIDDFGTGFSSLRYLEDLPLDNLKIDKSFIERLGDSNPELSLTNTIIGIAEAFSLGTVAEGVETEEQLLKVLALGCDCIQGYYFSKPVDASELPETILRIEHQLTQTRAAA